ncbi:MAG: prealbumin-like fold domain-containing protein [Peptostreptococcaceae bacterium]|nr:prealbumin-like fold domain-containing protein [Peptostreptococcaceae bacterium]MDY5739032.1 prealbumin-like fold domain-containing protein [Anaerovoracaceae bacterium]
MIKNKKANKTISVFAIILMMFGMFVTSFKQAGVVYADSENVTLNGSSNPVGGFSVNGHTSLGNNYNIHSAAGARMRSSGGNMLLCLDPLVEATNGTHTTQNLLGYQGLSQYDINYLAAGVDYLNRNYDANNAEALAQFFIWDYLNGKTSFNATVTATSMSADTYSTGLARAHAFANEKASTAVGSGILYTNGSSQPLAAFSISYNGYGQVLKTSANPDAKALTGLCPLYTLAGAEYTFYADAKCTVAKGVVTTVADGSSNKIKLPAGTYFVKETKAPFGYVLDSKVYTATIVSGQTTTVDVKDRPMLDPLNVVVQKSVEEGADKNLSAKGAEFEIKYYPTLSDVTNAEATRTWNFAADEKGEVRYKDSFKISGDELFKYKDAPIGIIGTYTIKETKAPKGLALDERTIYVRIAPNADSTDTVRTYSEQPEFTNPKEIKKGEALFDQIEKTQKVNLHLQKVDAETKQPVPQGYGTLEGAIYSVFRFDPLAAEDEFVADIVTDAAGKAV